MKSNNPFSLKVLGVFSVIRGYNILMICIAQYLAALFVLANKPFEETLFDKYLLILVVSGALAVAAGYIINSFYDQEKDLINKPLKTEIDQLVGQKTKLKLYFLLNIGSVMVASFVSFRAVVFFSTYIFGIWLYSHKFKRIPLFGNFISAILSIVPFFAIFIYYQNYEKVVFVHAFYLFLLILIREFVKDLENIKGDFLLDYQTIPVKYGERASRIIISVLVGLSFVPSYFLIFEFDIDYFIPISFALFLCGLGIWSARNKKQYHFLHLFLKIILAIGVFSVVFIE